MKSKISKKIIFSSLALILALAPIGISWALSDNDEINSDISISKSAVVKEKEEIVYATLSSDGSPKGIYIVNHFALLSGGLVTDYGKYDSVSNLTDLNQLTNDGNSIVFTADAGNFYYQGNSSTMELPWIIDISYYLNDIEISASELAGKSGDLKINIKTRENQSVNPAFYDSYMLQISVTLNNDKSDDVRATGATMASAGENTVATFTVMPGNNADISIYATVYDFEMAGIDIAGMPFSMNIELPDMDGMLNQFTTLSDAISDLNEGVGEFATGASALAEGAETLSDGSKSMKSGLDELNNSSNQLISGSAQIRMALSIMSRSIQGQSANNISLEDLNQIPEALSKLSEGLSSISQALVELNSGFSQSYAALDAAILEIPDATLSESQITSLYAQADQNQKVVLNELTSTYKAAQTVKNTYDKVKDAFYAVMSSQSAMSSSLDVMILSVNTMSSSINEALKSASALTQLEQLVSSLSMLSENYNQFHSGLLQYTDGVDAIATGYAEFDEGLATYAGGVGEFDEGVLKLHDGTKTLAAETSKLPDTVKEEINKLLDDYTGSDFEPVSFTSKENSGVKLVQFVLKSDGVVKPEEAVKIPEEPAKQTMWDRFIALFK